MGPGSPLKLLALSHLRALELGGGGNVCLLLSGRPTFASIELS